MVQIKLFSIRYIILSLIIRQIILFPNLDFDILELYNFIKANINESVQVLNNIDFRKYYYIHNLSDIKKLQIKMPNLNFTNCIIKLQKEYNISDVNNIYIALLEFNNEELNILTKAINSTIYKFFTKNIIREGFLNHSICNNIKINVSKNVQTNKISYEEIKEINTKYNISVYNNETKLIDYCSPLNINNKDMTVYDRQLFIIEEHKTLR